MKKAVSCGKGNQNFLFRNYLDPSSVDVSPRSFFIAYVLANYYGF